MNYFEINGSPREIGRQHGKKFRDLITTEVKMSCTNQFAVQDKKRAEERRNTLLKLEEYLGTKYPNIDEELRGIAEGSGLPYETILWFNFTEDIDYEYYNEKTYRCTSLIFPTSVDGPLLSKTDDITADQAPYKVMFKITSKNGYKSLGMGVTGLYLLSTGVNSKGLACGGSSLLINKEKDLGITTNFVGRMVLENCSSVDEAKDYLSDLEILKTAANMTFLDANGKGIVVGKYPEGQYSIESSKEPLICLNHVLNKEYIDLEDRNYPQLLNNSKKRYKNLIKLIPKTEKSIKGMKEIIRNHDEGAICQHGQDNMSTLFSYIINPFERKILAEEGFPCINEYETFTLD